MEPIVLTLILNATTFNYEFTNLIHQEIKTLQQRKYIIKSEHQPITDLREFNLQSAAARIDISPIQ